MGRLSQLADTGQKDIEKNKQAVKRYSITVAELLFSDNDTT